MNDIDDSIVERFKQWAVKKGCIDKGILDEPKDVLMEKRHLMNGHYFSLSCFFGLSFFLILCFLKMQNLILRLLDETHFIW